MGKSGSWLNLGRQSFEFNEQSESREFSGVSYSGGEITDRFVFASNGKFYSKLVIDVEGAGEKTRKMNPGLDVSSFYNHDQNQILGFGKLKFQNDIRIHGKFSSHTPEADKVYNLMKEGFPMQQSVYIATDEIDGIDSGKVKLNGREFDAPIAVLRNGHIREVSLCPIGADPETSAQAFSVDGYVSIEELKKQQGEKDMKLNLEKFTFLNDEQKAEYTKIFEKDQFAAFEYAQKLCPCQDKEKSENGEDEETASDEENEDKEESEALKASKKEIEKLTSDLKESGEKISSLETKVTDLAKQAEKFKDIDPKLFEHEENPKDQAKTKVLVERTRDLMKKDPNLSFNQAWAKISKEVAAA